VPIASVIEIINRTDVVDKKNVRNLIFICQPKPPQLIYGFLIYRLRVNKQHLPDLGIQSAEKANSYLFAQIQINEESVSALCHTLGDLP
jgi:hypothetical protein